MPSNIRRNFILSLDPNSGVPALKVSLIGPQRLPLGVPLGTAGYNNAVGFAGRGGLGPPYTFTILSGAIPTGLTFNNITGQWTGTPTVQGGFNFVVRISDGTNTSDRAFHMEVFGALFPLFGHYQPTPATRTRPYSYQVLFADVTGSTSGITYSLSPGSGALPTGITLSAAGLLSAASVTGAIGTYWFSVRGTKGGATIDVPMSIAVSTNLTALGVTGHADAAISTMLVGQYVDLAVSVTATGGGSPGLAPLTWSTSSTLPDGLSLVTLKDGTARIRGTPTAVTDNTFVQPTLVVTDATGQSRNVLFGAAGVPAMSVNSSLSAAVKKGLVFQANSLGLPQPFDFFATFFGDLADGSITIDGAHNYTFATLSGGVNTMQRDIYCDTVTISTGGILRATGKFDIYCNVLDLTNATSADMIQCFVPGSGGGTAGGVGSATTGGNGTNFNPSGITRAGGQGALGRTGGTGSGGAAGVGGSISPPANPNRQYDTTFTKNDIRINADNSNLDWVRGGNDGTGGGAGAGNGTTAGGNGGAGGKGGARLRIFARTIITSASTAVGVIAADGNDGAVGSNNATSGCGGGSGGGGGGGGFIRIVYLDRQGPTVVGALSADGGNGGNGGTGNPTPTRDALGGNGAEGGLIIVTDLQPMTSTVTIGAAGALSSTRTGALGGLCSANL